MKYIAVFASGSGTNAERISQYFASHHSTRVKLIATENPAAGVLERAKNIGVDTYIFNMSELKSGAVLYKLEEQGIDFVVLAGFLKMIPENIVIAYPGRIVNIHPALLPKYGGKGMYGERVHRAIIAAGETESGITIHFVNQKYDEGDIIFQEKCRVYANDTPKTLAQRIHDLEYQHYPRVIEELLERL